MKNEIDKNLSPVLFIPHGGGPLPLMGDEAHKEMVDFLRKIVLDVDTPSAILIISAHWEESKVTITSGKSPSLIHDYYGFPEEAYKIKYPAPGDPALASKLFELLNECGIESLLDDQRGFDHGLFVPLKIMFPEASIPCVQLSLVNSLSPDVHINIGKAIAGLRKDKVLVIGSGFSFHNLKAFFSQTVNERDTENEEFEKWLIETCTNNNLSEQDREAKLVSWASAPFARYCHPREEHLLPLHVCYGMSGSAAKLVFDGKVMGKKASAFLW